MILEYHGITPDTTHTSDMDASKIQGTIIKEAPVKSTLICVGRNIDGFGLSPGITKQQRIDVESLMKKAFSTLKGDLAGSYFPLSELSGNKRKELSKIGFLFTNGDPIMKAALMERGFPEGRGIFHNKEKTFLAWVNEEDHVKVIASQKNGNIEVLFLNQLFQNNHFNNNFILR